MKFELPTIVFFLADSVNAAKNMLRKRDGSLPRMPLNDDRKLQISAHQNDINSGTPVVDLCDYYPEYGVFDPLPIEINEGEPEEVFKIENAAHVTFTFSTCDEHIVCGSTIISIWDGFDQGDEEYLAWDDDSCDNEMALLSWTPPDDSVYYVRFGLWFPDDFSGKATWSADAKLEHCFIPTSEPTSAPTSAPTTPAPGPKPSQLTCEMVNPCAVDSNRVGGAHGMRDDWLMGGTNTVEVYYPVCTSDSSNYYQECYAESTIASFSAGDVDPEHDDRDIVNCGCCPSDDMLPADIEAVVGSTDVCDLL